MYGYADLIRTDNTNWSIGDGEVYGELRGYLSIYLNLNRTDPNKTIYQPHLRFRVIFDDKQDISDMNYSNVNSAQFEIPYRFAKL